MSAWSYIAFSTTLRRAIARVRLTVGALFDGELTRPASSAASDRLRSEADFPK